MAQITIQATADIEDALLDGNNVNLNNNTTAFFNVGDASRVFRQVIQFDLSSIPSNATITSAIFSIRATGDSSTNARTFRVYRILRDWVIDEVTWNIYSTGNSWATAGCSNTTTDREATDIGSREYSASETLNEFKDFTLTASKIQEMITGGGFTNNGFLIQADTENNDLYTHNSSDNGTEAFNPKLVITYTTPGGNLLSSMI